MAYIPPHRRNSKDSERKTLIPEKLAPEFNRKLNLGTSKKSNSYKSWKITYAPDAISKWFLVGLEDDECSQPGVSLEPASVESVTRGSGEKRLVLVKPHSDKGGNDSKGKPWISILENVLPEFLSAVNNVKAQAERAEMEELKPTLVARFGKILFCGGSGSIRENHITEAVLRDLKRIFYTNVPDLYVDDIVSKVIPKVEVDSEEERHIYHIKLSDSTRPDATLSCKCRINEDKELQLYKVELNQVRNVVVDISCLGMDLDLRLMLCTKRLLTHLKDDETDSIRALVSSAVIDPEEKGGLRWPFGMESSGNRYHVVGVWHTVATVHQNASMSIRVRNADRYDFRTGTGEYSKEVVIKLKGILSELENAKVERASDMLEETLALIWEHFLSCEAPLA